MLRQAIQGISDLIIVPGLINLDFADVKTIMAGMGFAIWAPAWPKGKPRDERRQRGDLEPVARGRVGQGARGVIINVTGGPDLSLIEMSEASAIIQEAAHDEANIIFGAVVDPRDGRTGEDHRDRDGLRPHLGAQTSPRRRPRPRRSPVVRRGNRNPVSV